MGSEEQSAMAFRSDLDAIIPGVLQTGQLHGNEITKRINGQQDTEG